MLPLVLHHQIPLPLFHKIVLRSNVISRNIPPPASIPSIIFILIATSDSPYKNVIISPISNIVKLSLLGIIWNL